MPPTTTVPPPYKENAERCLASEFNFKNGPEDSFQNDYELKNKLIFYVIKREAFFVMSKGVWGTSQNALCFIMTKSLNSKISNKAYQNYYFFNF